MSFKPDEKEWMAYLYGELDEEAKQTFDQYLLENSDARLALEKFRNLRGMLASVEDKEVIAPPIVIRDDQAPPSGAAKRHVWNTSYFRATASIAASVILVILVGRLTGTQLTIADNELRLAFGSPVQQAEPRREIAPANALTEAEVQQMITASLDKNNDGIRATLEENQRKLDASIRSNLALSSGKMDRLVKEASTASQEQIRQFVDGIRAENMQQVKDYFQLTSTEQKKYIENLLVDFAKYLQQQRNDDLRLVQMRMNNLEQNTDIFKQETEQILSSIITTVGVPVSGETKY